MASLTSCCQILKNINLDIEDVAARRPGQGWPIGDGIKGVQAVVGSGRLGLGGDAGGGSGGVTDGGEGGDGWDGDGDGLNQWGGYCSKRNLRDGA